MPTRHSHPIPLLRLPEGLSYNWLDIEALCHRLGVITQPTLVTNGDNDTMMITENSYLLAHHIPNAQLRIYPDAGHGFLNQDPELFADHHAFLNGG